MYIKLLLKFISIRIYQYFFFTTMIIDNMLIFKIYIIILEIYYRDKKML